MSKANVSYRFLAKVLNGGAFTDTKTYRYRPYRDRAFVDSVWVRRTYVFRLPLADLGTVKALDNWEQVFYLEERV